MAAVGPQISVIVPIYNVRGYVGAAVRSLRAQTFPDFEAILVDDGSTDDSATEALHAAEGDCRFTLIRQANGGLSAARNTGLGRARGAYLAFLDGDGRLDPDFLQTLHAALQASGADWVACGVRFCNADGSTVDHSAGHGQRDVPARTLPHRFSLNDWTEVIAHFPSVWNKLYRRDLVDGLRFDEGMVFEDHAYFWQAAARTDHLCWVPFPLYLQSQGRQGQITREDSDRVFDQFRVLERLAEIAGSSPKTGAKVALARMATRLIFERAQTLVQPKRRARFLATARHFLAKRDLPWSPTWDDAISRSLGLALAGKMPLSILILSGATAASLDRTLSRLAGQTLRDCEVLVVPPSGLDETALASLTACVAGHNSRLQIRLLPLLPSGAADAVQTALHSATGRYVAVLRAGDLPHPAAYAGWVEGMIRQNARFGFSRFCLQEPGDDSGAPRPATIREAFHQPTSVAQPLTYGRIALTAEACLQLRTDLSAKIFERALLVDCAAGLPLRDPVAQWGLVLRAALSARAQALYLDGVDIALAPSDPPHPSDPPSPAEQPEFGAADLAARIATLNSDLPEDAGLPTEWKDRLVSCALAQAQQRTDAQKVIPHRLQPPPPLPAGLSPPTPTLAIAPRRASPDTRAPPCCTQAGQTDPTMQKKVVPMLKYKATAGGNFSYEVEFKRFPYANISFYDQSRTQILFHMSLRQDSGLVVLNRRIGPEWEAERRTLARLGPKIARVEIAFAMSDAVTVQINGRQVVHCKGDFDQLDRIAYFDFFGALQDQTILADGHLLSARRGDGILQLAPDMTVSGWGYDAMQDHQMPTIVIAGMEGPLTPIIEARPEIAARLGADTDALGVSLSLPGRVWTTLSDDTSPLAIRLQVNGIPCGENLVLNRHQIVQQIEEMTKNPAERLTCRALMLAVEHVRFGKLWPHLSKQAQRVLSEHAAHARVRDFLFADQTPELPPALPVRHHPDEALLHDLLSRFGSALHAADPPDCPAALRGLLRGYEPPRVRRQLYLALTEVFCLNDAFPALYACAATDGLADFPPEDGGGISATLPFLYAQGRSADVIAGFKSLASGAGGWTCTPALGWVITDLVSPHPSTLNEEAREGIVLAFTAYLLETGQDTFNRTPCIRLIEAVVAALQAADRLTDKARNAIEVCALKVYGLSPQFWHSLGHPLQGPAARLSPKMLAAQSAFERIAAITQSGPAPFVGADAQTLTAALRLFEAVGCAQISRFRLELLGPSGMACDGDLPTVAKLMSERIDPFEAALRSLAHPTTTTGTAELADLARRAIPARYGAIALSQTRDLRLDVSRRSLDLLNHLFDKGICDHTANLLDSVLILCDTLCTKRSGFLGFGHALRLCAALGRNGAGPLADRVLTFVSTQITRLPQSDHAELNAAPALRSALYALMQAEAQTGCSQAGSGLALFPDLVAQIACSEGRKPADLRADPMQDATVARLAPLFNLLVVVVSCRAHLNSRIPALREAWLASLRDLGVPYIVVVGDGDGRRDGDIVHLDAPDTYEGLPQKTLAMVRWVLDHSSAAQILKIDDDCFVNTAEYVTAQSFASADYYGRIIRPQPGDMDRAWHIAKSSTPRGRMELDKSPEPSVYCDGGSGYVLSRHALHCLAWAAWEPRNHALQAASFMEDKLVGDLLATHGIQPQDTDNFTAKQHRTHPNGRAVSMWVNSFWPSQAAPVGLVHLDNNSQQASLKAHLPALDLKPKKIWPTTQATRLAFNSNTLELISPVARLATCTADPMAVVACVRNEMFMMPHFLAHYRALGVTSFLIADNTSDDGTLEYLAEQPDVAVFSVDTEYRHSQYGVTWQQALLSNFRVGRWSLLADADEFLVTDREGKRPITDLSAEADQQGADAMRVFMLDMYPKGPLSAARFTSGTPFAEAGFADRQPFVTNWPGRGCFSNGATFGSAMRYRLLPDARPGLFVAQKIAFLKYRPWMRLSAGLHYVAETRLARRDLLFAHFKYHADFRRKTMVEVARRQHFNSAEEYQKYMTLVAEGRDVIFAPGISEPWTESDFVRAVLGDKAGV